MILTVKDIVSKVYSVRLFNGHTIYLNDMEESEKKQVVTQIYYQISKVYSKKGTLIGQRFNEYANLTPLKLKMKSTTVNGLIRHEKRGGRLPVQLKKLERKFLEDDKKLAKQYPTIGDKIQAAFVVRLTNLERKELTFRLKRLGAKQVMIEDHTEGNRITTEPVHYIKYLFN